MAFDVKKIIDFLNPTYAQLKGLLIASVGVIGTVWFISAKTTDFQAQSKETNELTKQNTEMIKDIKTQMAQDRSDTKSDINKLYIDILDMNTRNNSYINNKFNLLINYGNSNKNLLKDMLNSLDEQQKLYEQDRLKNMEYWNTIKPPVTKTDSTYTPNVIVKKLEPNEKPGQVKKDEK